MILSAAASFGSSVLTAAQRSHEFFDEKPFSNSFFHSPPAKAVAGTRTRAASAAGRRRDFKRRLLSCAASVRTGVRRGSTGEDSSTAVAAVSPDGEEAA